MPAWSEASSPSSSGRDPVGHVGDRRQHALAAVARLVAVAQLDRLVGAGRGAARHRRRPTEPSSRTTSTSTVGLPRESRISRASTTSIASRAVSVFARALAQACRAASSRSLDPACAVDASRRGRLRLPGRCGLRLDLAALPCDLRAAGLRRLRLQPVPASRWLGRSSSTVTPGSSRPSRNSSDAPPPVEMWVILSARPCCGDGRDRVAAADHDRGAVLGPIGEHPRHGVRAVRERRDLEHAQRPVPEHGLDVGRAPRP